MIFCYPSQQILTTSLESVIRGLLSFHQKCFLTLKMRQNHFRLTPLEGGGLTTLTQAVLSARNGVVLVLGILSISS